MFQTASTIKFHFAYANGPRGTFTLLLLGMCDTVDPSETSLVFYNILMLLLRGFYFCTGAQGLWKLRFGIS